MNSCLLFLRPLGPTVTWKGSETKDKEKQSFVHLFSHNCQLAGESESAKCLQNLAWLKLKWPICLFNFIFCIFNFLTKQTHNPSICDISPQCACLQERTDLLSWASVAVNWELRTVAVKWELGKEGLEALPPDPAPHSYHTLTSCKSSTNPKKSIFYLDLSSAAISTGCLKIKRWICVSFYDIWHSTTVFCIIPYYLSKTVASVRTEQDVIFISARIDMRNLFSLNRSHGCDDRLILFPTNA